MSRIVSVNMDYNHADHSTGEHDGSEHSDRDMDIMHDFGEGVGVDMRDFTNHIEGEEVETDGPLEALAALEKDVNVHLTPTQNHLGPAIQQVLTPRMSHSLTPTGIDTTSIQHGSSAEPSSSGVDMNDIFKTETGLDDDDDEDELDGESQAGPELTPDVEQTPQSKRPRHNDVPGGFTFVDKDGESGRRKIRIEYISDKSRRHITFSKRKAGIMKKAYELSILTGTQVLLLVVSETGLVYTFTTTKLQPLVQKAEGKNLIQACLNAPDGLGPDGQPLGGPVNPTKSKNGGLAIRPHKLTAKASAALAASAQAASMGQTSGEESTQQSDAAAAVGQGTPTSARPKKRLPSGKGKKAQATAIGTGEIGSSELVPPPVPTIPDMHRQSSPAHMMPQQQQLTSPMSAGYHIPTEYHHQHHQHQPSPTQPTFGYTGGQPGAQEYQGGYYGGPPAGHPGHTAQHPTYLNVQQQHIQYQVDSRERARMMMEQNRAMEMGI